MSSGCFVLISIIHAHKLNIAWYVEALESWWVQSSVSWYCILFMHLLFFLEK